MSLPVEYTSLFPQSNLNPQFWDKNEKLNQDIRYKLLKVAKEFIDSWDLTTLGIKDKISIKDVLFTGSMTNYNYSKFSDLDLHIVVDFDKIKSEYKETVKNYLLAQKSIFNSEHDIKILGYDVEVYPEDLTQPANASGVYSLVKDKWVSKPEYIKPTPNTKYILYKYKVIESLYNRIVNSQADDKTKSNLLTYLTKTIKKMRQNGLNAGGEYNDDNLLFKVMRRTGLLDKIWDLKIHYTDKTLSL